MHFAVRLFTVKPVRHLPAVHITKNYDIYLSLDESIHKAASLQLEPLELLGFNVGEVVPSEGMGWSKLGSTEPKHLNF